VKTLAAFPSFPTRAFLAVPLDVLHGGLGHLFNMLVLWILAAMSGFRPLSAAALYIVGGVVATLSSSCPTLESTALWSAPRRLAAALGAYAVLFQPPVLTLVGGCSFRCRQCCSRVLVLCPIRRGTNARLGGARRRIHLRSLSHCPSDGRSCEELPAPERSAARAGWS
jgi:hypothetical protein